MRAHAPRPCLPHLLLIACLAVGARAAGTAADAAAAKREAQLNAAAGPAAGKHWQEATQLQAELNDIRPYAKLVVPGRSPGQGI